MSCHFFVLSISFAVIFVSKSGLSGSTKISSLFLLNSLCFLCLSEDLFVFSIADWFRSSGGSPFELGIFRNPYLSLTSASPIVGMSILRGIRTCRYWGTHCLQSRCWESVFQRIRLQGHWFSVFAVGNKSFLFSRNRTGTTSQKYHPYPTSQNYSSAYSDSIFPSLKKSHLEQANSMTLLYRVGFVGAAKDRVCCKRVDEWVSWCRLLSCW